MAFQSVRAPSSSGLVASAMVLLLLAAIGFQDAAVNVAHSRVPFALVAGVAIRDVVLAAVLLFVAVRKSRFAGPTAVFVATLLTFTFIVSAVAAVVFSSVRLSWLSASHLVVGAALLWLLLSRNENKTVLIWAGIIFGALTAFVGSLAVLARL